MVSVNMPLPPRCVKHSPPAESCAGLETLVSAVAELLFGFGSTVPVTTVAVLLRLLVTEQLTLATSVMVADDPAPSEAKVIVRLLPAPPQTPPPVEAHAVKVVPAGRLSVTTTLLAGFCPVLLTVRV